MDKKLPNQIVVQKYFGNDTLAFWERLIFRLWIDNEIFYQLNVDSFDVQ